MRIALVAAPWLPVPPPAYGGTEGVIDRLATGFVAEGHEVLLFTTGDSTCPVPRAWVRARSDLDLLGQSVIELQHLIHAYHEVADFDVIHDHTVLGPVYAQGRCSGQVVTTNHGPFTPEANDIYAQVVDDVGGRTLAAASTLSSDLEAHEGHRGNIEAAKKVGALVAARAKEAGIVDVVFDRNGYLYHGRLKALADAAREAGLNF